MGGPFIDDTCLALATTRRGENEIKFEFQGAYQKISLSVYFHGSMLSFLVYSHMLYCLS